MNGLAGRYGEFDPWVHFFGPRGEYVSSKDYESQVYSMVEADLCESLRGGSAPVKSAYEVLRHLRDLMRTVIEFKGLTLESYLDFRDNIKTRVNRIVAGPPAVRSKQLLALIDADIVTVPFGPSPSVEPARDGGVPAGLEALRASALRAGGLAHPRAPREPDGLALDLLPLDEPLAGREAPAPLLRRDRGGQRRLGRGVPPDRCLGGCRRDESGCSARSPRACGTSLIMSLPPRAACGPSSTPSNASRRSWAEAKPCVAGYCATAS